VIARIAALALPRQRFAREVARASHGGRQRSNDDALSVAGMRVAVCRWMEERTAEEIELASAATPLDDTSRAYDRLLEEIGDARFVLLGEASHGTHEFYRERALVTERLISKKGFDAVAVEADWPDAHRVHRYIRGHGTDRTPDDALGGFHRFPRWMWRNTDVRDFVGWLRRSAPEVGFYGLDLYSLHASIEVVLTYLDHIDPRAAKRARARYSCFEHFGVDTSAYAYAAGLGLAPSCEREVTQQLLEMQAHALEARRRGGGEDEELRFVAEQNARLVKDAEAYYRSMLKGSVVTWNLRDRHMADTLASIVQHLDHRLGRPAKIVVWAHNSHLGDARATELGAQGELNVGQLVRERYGRDAFLLGFTTNEGTVTAALEWGDKPLRMAVRPAIAGSHELALHSFSLATGVADVLFLPDRNAGGIDAGRLPKALRHERLERAIGVVYRPQTERQSHWFHARLGDQFDAVIHLDRTSALDPLDPPHVEELEEEVPETFPFAV
jgi:erythromycin esterase-like protein